MFVLFVQFVALILEIFPLAYVNEQQYLWITPCETLI